MEPEIRYCTSADGTRIAYTVYGRGKPALVFIVGWGITFQLEAQFDEGIAFYGRLSEKRMVVRYDPRGIGASSHGDDHSTDAHCSDAEAVISALELETYDLFGTASGSPIALLHAYRHPESVRRIVLWEGWSAGNWEPKESVRAVVDLVKANWPLATRVMTDLMGVQGEDMRRRWARLLTTSIEPNAAVAYFESRFEIDVTDVVGDIAQPALLLHRHGNTRMPVKVARELASKLPNARFVELPGKAEPWILDHEDYLSKVEEFLDEDTPSDGEPRAAKEEVAAAANLTRVSAPEARSFASGRYVVKRLLGEGAQKSVYLVDDTTLDRECALSVLNAALLDPNDVDRIKREAQTMAKFGSQPNIVTVYDYGEEDGAPYIVCEYVPGGELRGELAAAAGPLPLERALTVAIDICRALSFAHRRDVVHRDLKPENVWLTEQRSAKLGDFGIALSIGRARLTMPGGVTGTATYMAPEQISGGDVDARSDLYAFGVLLYELVAGRPPFIGDDPNAIMYQHVNAEPESPVEHNASVPPRLERLIIRLLAKTKAQRPGSAEEVLAELERAGDELAGGRADVNTMPSTDMDSSTPRAQSLGDTDGLEIHPAYAGIVHAALEAHDGTEMNHSGGDITASFATASSALECAIAIQRGVAVHRDEHPDSPLAVHIDLNAGEPIADERDPADTSINLAARICDHAEPGQIVAADVVRKLAAGKQFLFSDLGEVELQGFEDAVKLWELRWDGT